MINKMARNTLAFAVALGVFGTALAQGPGGWGGPGGNGANQGRPQGGPGGPGGRGGFAPTPEMRAQFDAMRKFQESHPNFHAVERTLRGLSRLQGDPSTALNKAQARRILTILGDWRHKPVMTDAQAKVVDARFTDILSKTQLVQLASEPEGRGGFRGGPGGPGGPGAPGGQARSNGRGPGGFGGPGGQGGPGQRPHWSGGNGQPPPPPGKPGAAPKVAAIKEFNPLNPDSYPIDRMRQRAAEHLDELVAQLKLIAK